jgi:OOP family OmpA-OmpF porin
MGEHSLICSKKPSMAFRLGTIGLAVLGATMAAPSFAELAPGWYVGGNVGRANADDFDSNGFGIVPPAAVTGSSQDEHDTGYKLYGGYQFHRNFAAEFGYFNLGRYNYGFTTAGGAFNGNTRFQGLNLDLVGTFPITDRFSAFARIGAAYTQARSSGAGAGTLAGVTASGTDRSWGAKGGLGLEYAFTPNLAVRGEWERYRVEDGVRGRGNIDMWSVGLVYRFGAPAVTRVIAPAPTYVPAPAPAPAPRVVPPPPPPPAVAPAPAPVPAPAPAVRPYRS